jgi:hypothetical protein
MLKFIIEGKREETLFTSVMEPHKEFRGLFMVHVEDMNWDPVINMYV